LRLAPLFQTAPLGGLEGYGLRVAGYKLQVNRLGELNPNFNALTRNL
jgi:hypothetical protein